MSDITKRTVVVAVDASETADYAFHWTLDNFLRDTDHLRLIHVQPFHEVSDVIAGPEMAVPIYSAGKVREESLSIAKKFAKLCREKDLKDFKEDIILEDGSAGAAICDYLQALPVDPTKVILVIGSRELGFFSRAFLGSVSEHCVRNAHCPVVVVKMPPKSSA